MSDDLIIVGDEAWLPEELERRERKLQRDRERRRLLRADPAHREKLNAYHRAWYEAHREQQREYHREYMARQRGARVTYATASLHSLRCTGPTRATGCRCHKLRVMTLVPRESAA